MVRPVNLFALRLQGLLLLSFHIASYLYNMSDIANRSNNQFPIWDFHPFSNAAL
ncbi:hypothetical protein KsCSTR_14090 [Candidatus Kuenenia stuttgartiensis]|nr:hypothetical protein KsCSTR_14090 [Candidatus Kuenenia stuttgartiensis]CAJ73757.1 unknown protein [Candidatus Kuenenia stuttgartiensis]